jgi:hypothetical protein
MYKNCYGICFTPETYTSYIGWWTYFKNKEDVFYIVDNSKNKPINYNAFLYTENDIRNNFNFKKDVSRGHYWNHAGNRNIIWFYAYLRMINFYIANPNYEYYWFFDDDVSCDNWDEFLNGFQNDDSDFLSYFLFKNSNVEGYPEIPKADHRMHSKGLWFQRFPGHGDELSPEIKDYFGSFFAIVRYSNKAMQELVNITKNGFSGYGEGFVPSYLASRNLKMNTIFNPDNTSNYFNQKIANIKHKNQLITWEWL